MYKLSQTNLFFSRFEGTRGEKYKYLAPKFRAKMMMVMVWLFGTLVALPNLISFHVSKGQLNSEWIYDVIVSPKMPTKNFSDFCPTL